MDEVQTPIAPPAVSPGTLVEHAPVDQAALAPSRPRRGIGAVALLLAVAMVIAGVVAVWIGATPDAAQAVVPAVTALGFSLLAVAIGLVAVIANRGRTLGVIALGVAVVLNPFLFTQALGWLGSL